MKKYNQIIDSVEKKYKALKKVAPDDLAEIVADLKKSWKHIVKIAKTESVSNKKSTKKVAKKK
jgi:uncharacterized protein YoxC